MLILALWCSAFFLPGAAEAQVRLTPAATCSQNGNVFPSVVTCEVTFTRVSDGQIEKDINVIFKVDVTPEANIFGVRINPTGGGFNATTGVRTLIFAGNSFDTALPPGTWGLSFIISDFNSRHVEVTTYGIRNLITISKFSPVMTITNNFPVIRFGDATKTFFPTISGGYRSPSVPNAVYWTVSYINSNGERHFSEVYAFQNAKSWYFPEGLTAGTWTVEVTYHGDPLNNPVTATTTVIVEKYNSVLSLRSDRQGPGNTYRVGETVRLTAQLANGPGTPTALPPPQGLVTVKQGSSVVGSGHTDSNGLYVVITEPLTFERLGLVRPAIGQNVIVNLQADYAGSDQYDPSSATGGFRLIADAGVATPHIAPSVTTIAAGGSFTIFAQLTSSFQTFTPSGTVTFEDMTSGSPVAIGSAIRINSTGGATGPVTAPALGGIARYRYSYSGDQDHPAVVSPEVQVTILAPAATTTLAVSNPAPAFGAAVTLTATVTGSAPSGTVTFKDGATTLGTATLSGPAAARSGGPGTRSAAPAGTSNTAALTVSALSGGAHSITAVYAGDANNGGSTSPAVTVTVARATTTTALQSSSPGGTFGTSITFTATVTGSTPTGSVTFKDGATTLGTGTIASGVASLSTTALVVGARSITAVYAGDVNNATSTSTATTVTMTQSTGVIALQASSASPAFGSSVTFTATMTPLAATGSVTFKDGATTLGSGTLSGGVATFSTSALTAGPHSITAVFAGDVNLTTATSSAVSVTVGKATANVALATSAASVAAGANVTLTATISPAAATGIVTFKNGNANLGTGTIAAGVATFSTTALAVGNHSITAVYAGDANHNTGTSAALSQVVGAATSSVALTASSNAPAYGASVTFTATVTGASVTGTVTFTDTTTSQTLGTGAVSGGVATFSTSTLASGAHAVVAAYGGDANNIASTSPAVTVTVAPSTSSVALTSTSASPGLGASVIFTATVTGVTPTGTVTFKDGATTIGTGNVTGGVATFTTTALALGPHSITAVYSGDVKNVGSTSAVLNITVLQNTGAVALTSSDNGPAIGTNITLTATLTASGTPPTGTVTFKDGATVLGTTAVAAGKATFATATLTLGAHALTAAYSGDGNYVAVTSAALTVTVKPPTPVVSATPISVNYGNGGPIDLSQIVSGGATCVEIVTPPTNGNATVTCNGQAAAALAARASAASVRAAAPAGSIVVNYRPRPGYSGPDNFAIVATGPGGRSNAANIALVVAARPSPLANADLAGLVNAQVSTMRRLGQSQMTNVSGRLEQLHDEDLPEVSMGIGFTAPEPITEQERFRLAIDPKLQSTRAFNDSMTRLNKDLDKTFGASNAQARSGRRGPTDWSVWSSGTISLGKENNQGGTTSRFTSEGVTVGIDKRMAEGLRVGFAIGFGADRTRIGTTGTTNSGYNVSGTAYASYRVMPQTFVDAMLGFGQAQLSSRRFDPTSTAFLTGRRSGQEVHGAISLTYEAKWGKLKVAPYGRLEVLHLNLGSFNEEGLSTATMRFGSLSSTSYSGVVGVRTSYPFTMSWGTLTMLGRMEYRQTSEGGYRQSLDYADSPGSMAFSLVNKTSGSGQIMFGLGTKFQFDDAGALDFEYQFSTSTTNTNNASHSLRGRYNYNF